MTYTVTQADRDAAASCRELNPPTKHSEPAMTNEQIAKVLTALERERITGWRGPAGAAYNAISVGLHKRGILNSDWTLSRHGLAVRAILEKQDD